MKRIIGAILLVAILALSLFGCGYSLADDNMANYATFSSEEKAAFEKAIKALIIENGEFLLDPDVREEKVLDNIYAAISEAEGDEAEKLTVGIPNGRDVVYYSYYVTADFDGVTSVLYADKMKSTSPVSIQLRPSGDYGDDEVSEALYELLTDYFASHKFEDKVYASVSTGTTVEGDVAYVTYTKTLDGDTTVEPEVYTNHRIVIGKAPEGEAKATTIESYLSGKTISASLEKFTATEGEKSYTYSNIKINWVSSRITEGVANEGDKAYVSYTKKVGDGEAESIKNELVVIGAPVADGETATTLASYLSGQKIGESPAEFKVTEGENEVTYSVIKINWVAGNDDAIGTFTDVTYDEETLVTDTRGNKRDLKDKELTYHIYPVYFTETSEYTTELLINTVFGKDLTEDIIFEILFVNEYAALDDDATEDEKNAIKELGAKYKTDDSLSIADMVKKIVAYYTDIKTAQTALDNADKELSDAEAKYDEAKAAYDAENAKPDGEKDAEKLQELQNKLAAADEALNGKAGEAEDAKTGAKANQVKAQAAYDKIEADKVANVKKLLDIKGEGQTDDLRTVLYKNYKVLTYNYLQSSYNEEIKTNLAREIYYFITKNVKLGTKLPEEAVEDAYDQIFESYESAFYTGTYDTQKGISNYKQYGGNFNKFLIDKVTADIKKVETVKDAKAAIEEKARQSVEPIVQIFLVADVYDQVITDKEYEDFKDELEEYYYYYVLYYKNFSIEEMLGKNNIMTAAQFNKLMDWFLAFEEVKAEAPDKNGYIQVTYKYTNELVGNSYTFGDPASAANDAAEGE